MTDAAQDQTRTGGRLLPEARRRTAVWLLLGSVVVTAALGVVYAGGRVPGRVDRPLTSAVNTLLDPHLGLQRLVLRIADPLPVVLAILALAGYCAIRRRWAGLVLVLLGPALALGVTELLKPITGRTIGADAQWLSYPSGHTTSVSALVVAAWVLLSGLTRAWRTAQLALSALVLVAVASTLVGLGYHYPTDIVGGFCVALGTVLALALALDRRSRRA
ncbi:phosphatase PAP2 family protein [Solihabitans fulvus]|uniref:Phosphatase PAP2 family protein n=1 Tax=Solihabitans fulvus TaxID=1892852 RepID=A0A5B2WRA1_9PSEU|nr:phosphatase PAP2 family protein [Solihabitans fulvus]KAA2254035.1 phosphatase PAP2 family protein [Solihabitans fulvus]